MTDDIEREKYIEFAMGKYGWNRTNAAGHYDRNDYLRDAWQARAALDASPAGEDGEWKAVDALRRIASSECFDVPRMIDKDGKDKELFMRMDFARRMVEMIDSRATKPADEEKLALIEYARRHDGDWDRGTDGDKGILFGFTERQTKKV